MKNYFSAYILLFCYCVSAQSFQETKTTSQNTVADVSRTYQSQDTEPSDQDAFIVAALENGIPQRTFSDIPDVKNGYYLVSGVFSKSKRLSNQVKKLSKKGFDSGYFLARADQKLPGL